MLALESHDKLLPLVELVALPPRVDLSREVPRPALCREVPGCMSVEPAESRRWSAAGISCNGELLLSISSLFLFEP